MKSRWTHGVAAIIAALLASSVSLAQPTPGGGGGGGTPGGSPGDVQVNSAGSFGGVAPGASGNVLTSTGSAWGSATPGTGGTVTSITLAPGLTKTVGTCNPGTDAITTTGTISPQICIVNKAVNYTVATTDTGNLLTTTGAGVTYTVPNPSAGTKGTSYQFASDGTNGYSITTVGGTATIYGCAVTSGTTTAVFPAKVDVQIIDDGTNYKCTALSGVASVGQLAGLGSNVATFLGTPSSANLAAALTDETGTGATVFAQSPTLVTPALGTPSALVLTNATGLPIAQIGASPASHAVPVDVAGTSTWKVLPDCTDTAGNHINYTQSTDAFSCGTSGGSSGASQAISRQRFTSGTAATYTTPANATVLRITQCAGGGGSGGLGAGSGTGGTGGTTTFNSITVIGGSGGTGTNSTTGGVGGIGGQGGTGALGTGGFRTTGGDGTDGGNVVGAIAQVPGGVGGDTALGAFQAATASNNGAGANGVNSASVLTGGSGGGGGGECAQIIQTSPAATYTYTVGAAGAAGAGATAGLAGNAGVIWVDEYYGIISTTLTNHAPLIGTGSGIGATAAMSNGQLAIGSTGADPVPATITAGSNITVTNGPGSITIAASGGGTVNSCDAWITAASTMVSGGSCGSVSGGVWTSPSWITATTNIKIEACGGGGGGGGSVTAGRIGYAGGGGGLVVHTAANLIAASTGYSFAIGSPGAAGVGSGAATAGTATTLTIGGTTWTANGGAAGTSDTATFVGTIAGGTASNGNVSNITGGAGGSIGQGVSPSANLMPFGMGGELKVGGASNGAVGTGLCVGGSGSRSAGSSQTGGAGLGGLIHIVLSGA